MGRIERDIRLHLRESGMGDLLQNMGKCVRPSIKA